MTEHDYTQMATTVEVHDAGAGDARLTFDCSLGGVRARVALRIGPDQVAKMLPQLGHIATQGHTERTSAMPQESSAPYIGYRRAGAGGEKPVSPCGRVPMEIVVLPAPKEDGHDE